MILIAEDHIDTAMLLKRALEGDGYQAELVHDGQAVLDLLRKITPQLIILDVMMPKITGLEVLEMMNVHANWKQIPVIIYSASFQPEHEEVAARLGAKEYLVKGAVDLTAILAAVEKHSITRSV